MLDYLSLVDFPSLCLYHIIDTREVVCLPSGMHDSQDILQGITHFLVSTLEDNILPWMLCGDVSLHHAAIHQNHFVIDLGMTREDRYH